MGLDEVSKAQRRTIAEMPHPVVSITRLARYESRLSTLPYIRVVFDTGPRILDAVIWVICPLGYVDRLAM